MVDMENQENAPLLGTPRESNGDWPEPRRTLARCSLDTNGGPLPAESHQSIAASVLHMSHKQKLGLGGLVCLIYLEVCGGPFGSEVRPLPSSCQRGQTTHFVLLGPYLNIKAHKPKLKTISAAGRPNPGWKGRHCLPAVMRHEPALQLRCHSTSTSIKESDLLFFMFPAQCAMHLHAQQSTVTLATTIPFLRSGGCQGWWATSSHPWIRGPSIPLERSRGPGLC
jgi:hypothetical protein